MTRFNAASQYLCTDPALGVIDRARADVVGHVRAVAARYRPFASCADRAGAADNLQLSDRLCDRSDYLRADLRPPRPQAGPAGGDLRLRPRQRAMRDDAIDRRADCGALRAGAWRGRRHRAGACRGARPLFRRACRARTIADGVDPGLRADRRAAHRRRPADRIRLACEFHPAGDCLDRVRHGDRAASP